MYTIFSRISLSIFTSVVVYSRTTSPKKSTKHKFVFAMHTSLIWLISVYLNVFSNLHSCATQKRKKCGAHTHARTTVQLDECNIHVGCCLFSHDPHINKKKQKKMVLCLRAILILFSRICDLSLTCTVVQLKKKNAEHTRMYTNFRAFLSQYSRRLLSILAHPKD